MTLTCSASSKRKDAVKATIYGSGPRSALSLPCITNKSLFFVFDRTSHAVPAKRCPVLTGPRCSAILFVALHTASRKCALFRTALTKSKLKVLIVACPAMLAGAMDKAQMSACPMVRLTSDTACQKQHNSQRLRHRKSLLTTVSASKHFFRRVPFYLATTLSWTPIRNSTISDSYELRQLVPECGLTSNGLGKCHSGRRISTG